MGKGRCGRKAAYSKAEAEEQVIKRYHWKGRGGYAYHCDKCGWWHITKGEDTKAEREYEENFKAKYYASPPQDT